MTRSIDSRSRRSPDAILEVSFFKCFASGPRQLFSTSAIQSWLRIRVLQETSNEQNVA